jgi:glycerate 2-kinase
MSTAREDAEAIWKAAIRAVAPDQLIRNRLRVADGQLLVDKQLCDPPAAVPRNGRIVVVGGGKAAAGVAAGLEQLISDGLHLEGLVGVPEGCGRALPRIEVREVRPAGRNEPTDACVRATQEMLAMLGGLTAEDLAIAVVTGGGSAILTAPLPGIPLEEVVATTRWLSERGADISQLNRVRQAVSRVKAGGLARSCRAGRMVVLVISDVIGDPLDTISSGPCMPVPVNPHEVLATLEEFGVIEAGIAPSIVAHLQQAAAAETPHPTEATMPAHGNWHTPAGCLVSHHLLASNATAVDAAAMEASRLGYRVVIRHADPAASENADDVGRRLAAKGVAVPDDHGLGGRNQQTVAAALAWSQHHHGWPGELLIASVGTDGEDGPTPAAGAVADAAVAAAVADQKLPLSAALARCDAFPLLAAAGGLIHTGPTGTNVADLRILLATTPLTSPARR